MNRAKHIQNAGLAAALLVGLTGCGKFHAAPMTLKDVILPTSSNPSQAETEAERLKRLNEEQARSRTVDANRAGAEVQKELTPDAVGNPNPAAEAAASGSGENSGAADETRLLDPNLEKEAKALADKAAAATGSEDGGEPANADQAGGGTNAGSANGSAGNTASAAVGDTNGAGAAATGSAQGSENSNATGAPSGNATGAPAADGGQPAGQSKPETTGSVESLMDPLDTRPAQNSNGQASGGSNAAESGSAGAASTDSVARLPIRVENANLNPNDGGTTTPSSAGAAAATGAAADSTTQATITPGFVERIKGFFGYGVLGKDQAAAGTGSGDASTSDASKAGEFQLAVPNEITGNTLCHEISGRLRAMEPELVNSPVGLDAKTLALPTEYFTKLGASSQVTMNGKTYKGSEVQRAHFVCSIVPILVRYNTYPLVQRMKVQELQKLEGKGEKLSEANVKWLADLKAEYGLQPESTYEQLLERVDIVPLAMSLAMAAHHTAWGTQKNLGEAKSLFGLDGVKGKDACLDDQSSICIKKYESISDSASDFIRQMNTNTTTVTFVKFRKARAEMRAKRKKLDSTQLMQKMYGAYSNSLYRMRELVRNTGVMDYAFAEETPEAGSSTSPSTGK